MLMKTKIFTILVVLLASTTLWAQRFQVGDLYYEVVSNGSNNLELPIVSNPGAGYTTVVLYIPENTPSGCYAVGSFNWNETNTEKLFTPVDGVSERWVACTFDYADDIQLKVLAIPSDPNFPLSWSYQWGRNIDPDNYLEEDNVVILKGTGDLELENAGQPKLVGLADNSVVYIQVKNWDSDPYIDPVPCTTAAFSHPWNGDYYSWSYREATKTAEATFELNAIYGGIGVNVATEITGVNAIWYPEDQIEFVGNVAEGDSVNFKFISDIRTVGRMIITLIEKRNSGADEPLEAKDITVKAKVPASWTNIITAWVWPTNGEGQEVVPTKEGGWYVYTHHCAELNVIFKNGEGWNGDVNQSVDILGVRENVCLVLESDGTTKATRTNIDCDNSQYIPTKKPIARKNVSTDDTRFVVVTYESEYGNNYNLTDVTIPETVEYRGYTYKVIGIKDRAFYNSRINTITIPNSVKYIGYDAFLGCDNLNYTFHVGNLTSWCDIDFQGYRANPMCYSKNLYLSIPGTSYAEEVKGNLVIPNGVDSIRNYAFLECASITSVSIPNSVTNIGECAFYGCSSLAEITIPNGVKNIGEEAFAYCSALTSVSVPNSVTKIGRWAFEDCSSLTELSIPSNCVFEGIWEDDGSLQYWGYTIIVGCHNLKKLIVPASLFDMHEEDYLYVKSDYLPYCPEQLESLIINSGELSRLGWDFIERNNKTLKTIDLGETTSAAIAEKAFYDCYKLENLSLPSQLEHISYMAVAECIRLKSIEIPATVTEIEDRAFENCRMLAAVTFADNGALNRIGNWAFYNNHELTNLVIPEGVTEIGHAAFYGCTYLKEMTLPSTVQDIADNGFALCAKLQRMNVNALVPPIAAARTFEDVDRSIPVYVPDEVVDNYKAAPVWQEFNIQGKSNAPTGLENSLTISVNTQKIFYNGQIIIIRDGKTYNVMGQQL